MPTSYGEDTPPAIVASALVEDAAVDRAGWRAGAAARGLAGAGAAVAVAVPVHPTVAACVDGRRIRRWAWPAQVDPEQAIDGPRAALPRSVARVERSGSLAAPSVARLIRDELPVVRPGRTGAVHAAEAPVTLVAASTAVLGIVLDVGFTTVDGAAVAIVRPFVTFPVALTCIAGDLRARERGADVLAR